MMEAVVVLGEDLVVSEDDLVEKIVVPEPNLMDEVEAQNIVQDVVMEDPV